MLREARLFFAGFLVVGALVLAAGASSAAATPADPSTPTIPGLVVPSLVQDTETLSQAGSTFTGDVDVFLPDVGTGPTVYLRLSPGSALVPCQASRAATTSADQVVVIPVTCMASHLPKSFNPVIEVHVDGAEELFLPVSLRNDTEDGEIAQWPFLLGAAASLVTIAASFLWGKARNGRMSPGSLMRLGDLVGVDVAWSGGDSWVTNLTTVGGILGTVLAGSGTLSMFLVGIPTQRFEVVLLVLLTLGGIAPLVYALCSRRPPPAAAPPPAPASPPPAAAPVPVAPPVTGPAGKTNGTVYGMLLASLATLTAAYGQLVAAALLVRVGVASGNELAWLYLFLAVAAAMLFVYAVRSVASVLETADDTDPTRPVSMMTHSGTISGTL